MKIEVLKIEENMIQGREGRQWNMTYKGSSYVEYIEQQVMMKG